MGILSKYIGFGVPNFLAKLLIPHHQNNHHPWAIRHQSLLFFAVILVSIQSYSNLIIGKPGLLGYATNISVSEVIRLTNLERTTRGIPALTESSILDKGAQLKASDMFRDDYWAHFAPDGTSPWHFFSISGYKYSIAGENLAKNFQTSSGTVAGWMASKAGHRENLLNPAYNEIGVAVVDGVLLGEETTLVVQFLAKPVEYLAGTPVAGTSVGNKTTTPKETGKPVSIKDNLNLNNNEVNKKLAPVTPKETDSVSLTLEPINKTGVLSFSTLIAPVSNLNNAQKATLAILMLMISIFIVDSIIAFAHRRIRENSHSFLHASMLLILILVLVLQTKGFVI